MRDNRNSTPSTEDDRQYADPVDKRIDDQIDEKIDRRVDERIRERLDGEPDTHDPRYVPPRTTPVDEHLEERTMEERADRFARDRADRIARDRAETDADIRSRELADERARLMAEQRANRMNSARANNLEDRVVDERANRLADERIDRRVDDRIDDRIDDRVDRSVDNHVEHVAGPTVVTPTPVVERTQAPMASRIIYWLTGVILALLAIRLLFELIGARTGNAIVSAIYGITDVLVAPFTGILAQTNGLDIQTVVAMVGYAIIGFALAKLIDVLTPNRMR